MDVSLATFLVASFLFSALKREEIYESVRCTAERKKAFAFVILIQKAYLDLRRTVLRKRKRISRVAITRVPTHPSSSLLLLPSSSRCPRVQRKRFFFFRPCRSPFQRRTFLVWREKKMKKKKKRGCRQQKKCARQTRKREEEGFLDASSFFRCPLHQKSKSSKRAFSCIRIVSSLLSALIRFSFSSEYSFVALLVGRARVYISRNARSRRVSRETRREKERRKENVNETTIPRKREEEEERSNRFFGAVV